MSTFERTNFIFKHEQEDSISIFGEDSTPLFSATHDHSMKTPHVVGDMPLPFTRMKTTDILIKGKDGESLGEIHEVPTGTMRVIRKWLLYDQKGTQKGVVTEKPKFVGSDWVLKDVNDNLLAIAEGDRKKNNYEILTPDKGKQLIARCSSQGKDSYRVEVMASNLDTFLVLSYVIVLDFAKTAFVVAKSPFYLTPK
jgi:uncharacterized protein YxjI